MLSWTCIHCVYWPRLSITKWWWLWCWTLTVTFSQREISQTKERKTKLLNTDEKVQLNENILDPLNSIQRLCMSFGCIFIFFFVTVSLLLQHIDDTLSVSYVRATLCIFRLLSLNSQCVVCAFFLLLLLLLSFFSVWTCKSLHVFIKYVKSDRRNERERATEQVYSPNKRLRQAAAHTFRK